MKKSIIISAIALIVTGSAFAQPVSDRAVIPIGVTLTQILRIHVTNGGNIEFVFNDIDDYKNGINNNSGSGFYDSQVEIASSTSWELDMGAEDGTFIATDNPALNLNFTLDNVAFFTEWNGANSCCGAASAVDIGADYPTHITAAGGGDELSALRQYTGPGTARLFSPGTGNGGDVNDNVFTINWEAGTGSNVANTNAPGGIAALPAPNPVSILNQNLAPDRYVTNVFLELTLSP